jgi:hypothetical protein
MGRLWGIVNEQITTAHAASATSLTQVDPAGGDLWGAFRQRCADAQVDHFKRIVGDINDPALTADNRAG